MTLCRQLFQIILFNKIVKNHFHSRLVVLSISLDCSLVPITSQISVNGTNITSVPYKDETSLQQFIDNASNQIITLSTDSDVANPCKINILQIHVAFLILWSLALLVEVALIIVSLRGGILEVQLRWPAEYLLYVKLGEYDSKLYFAPGDTLAYYITKY